MQSLLIALHTSAFVIWKYKPSSLVIASVTSLIWLCIVLLTAIGPLHVLRIHSPSPFYDNAGLWCWIGPSFDRYRLWLHYFFVFVSALTSLGAYFSIFIFLYFRLFQRGAYNHHLFQLRRAADGKLVPDTPRAGEKPEKRRSKDVQADKRQKKMDRAAMMMLLFPATWAASLLFVTSW